MGSNNKMGRWRDASFGEVMGLVFGIIGGLIMFLCVIPFLLCCLYTYFCDPGDDVNHDDNRRHERSEKVSASEQRKRVLNSNSNHQGKFRSRPGANHIVRLDSEQMELLIHQQQNEE